MHPDITPTNNDAPRGQKPQIPAADPCRRTIEYSSLVPGQEHLLSGKAPHNGIVLVSVTDDLGRKLQVQELDADGTLVKWAGTQTAIDFKARSNHDWIATLAIVAVDAQGTPTAESKVSRVKLKGTILVGDHD